ncbi:hypothetical protein AQUCO_00600298v1 [Aquilegia coerulea]|uniref:Uncharacterized protein n=1 Tax=Aquilegia coerulea TaxID=218851 RepID=A0A2G5EPG9_AQUCA|nr:hypothetical protein AQUCO_00600298v1 [Aquilegia coerulea]
MLLPIALMMTSIKLTYMIIPFGLNSLFNRLTPKVYFHVNKLCSLNLSHRNALHRICIHFKICSTNSSHKKDQV